MPLRITKGTDPITIEQIVVCLYGPPGICKTSLSFTADRPILFDFDRGAHRAMFRKDAVIPESWKDVTDLTADDFAPYRTVIVDTAGRALDMLAAHIMAVDPKMGSGGALSLKGFGRLKSDFIAWLKLVKSFGLDVVLLAHMDEQKSGDDVIERIDAQGASKNEIYKSADAMGRVTIKNGKRMLLFSPTDAAFGKNPAELEPLTIPRFTPDSTCLADVITRTKGKLNELSEEQREVAAVLTEWQAKIEKATTAGKLNGLLFDADKLDPRVIDNAKRLLWSWAKDHGFTFDKKANAFTEKVEAVA